MQKCKKVGINMISSMTGYGRVNKVIDNYDITIEIKSVNHRFFDFSLRSLRAYSFLEDKIKSKISSKVTRGKIDVNLNIVNNDTNSIEVTLDEALMAGYINAFKKAEDSYNIKNDVKLSSLLGISELFKVKKQEENEDELWQKVSLVLDEALDSFLEMRIKEGAVLKNDVLTCLDEITLKINEIEEFYPKIVESYTNRLNEKLQKILQDNTLDSSRILTEAAIFADKTAINEETVRLVSHIEQMKGMLITSPIGKKLDFLIQEMNREVNTIGSKANDLQLTKIVVDLKSIIERIREQIQNVE
ncbi:MAG: YicC/YloC family endoribonuclease [Clostridia bacterium]